GICIAIGPKSIEICFCRNRPARIRMIAFTLCCELTLFVPGFARILTLPHYHFTTGSVMLRTGIGWANDLPMIFFNIQRAHVVVMGGSTNCIKTPAFFGPMHYNPLSRITAGTGFVIVAYH